MQYLAFLPHFHVADLRRHLTGVGVPLEPHENASRIRLLSLLLLLCALAALLDVLLDGGSILDIFVILAAIYGLTRTRSYWLAEALRTSEHRYRQLVEEAGDAVYSADPKGYFTYISPAGRRLIGYTEAQIIGRHFTEFIPAPWREQVRAFYVKQLRDQVRQTTFEFPIETKSGEIKWVEQVVTLLMDGAQVTGLQSIVRDISERKRNEELIRQSEERLVRSKERVEAILNNSSDAIIVAYPDGAFQQANPAFNSLFAYGADELFGKNLSLLVQPDYTDVFKVALSTVISTGKPHRLEVIAHRGDRSTFEADVVLSAIAGGHDEMPSGLICSLRDITERKQMEAELRQALEKEKELSELKTRFVSIASHEFRTPLATIQSTTDVLKYYRDRMTEDQISERYDKIHTQIRHMTTILDDVLTLGRIQEGKIGFTLVLVTVDPFVQEIIEELRGIHGTTCDLVYRCSDPDIQATVDRKLLRQIITNLLTNAIKYSPENSSVNIDVSSDQESFTLRVTDRGIGIPEEDQKQLFDTFHRAANVGNVSGTGLGLAITKQAVELHHGAIACESTVGVGTTFIVSIPLVHPGEATS